jgi:hypothetical protein
MPSPATTTNNNNNEKEWPVQLYRFTESDGWQKQQGAAVTMMTTTANRIAAAPRKDCIVIPALRQKFSLLSGQEKNCVIRRGCCILLVSRRRTRAMVLQFTSLDDCLAFSDRFLALNPPTPSTTTTEVQGTQEAAAVAAAVAAGPNDQEQVVSYVARLLHDKDFLGFVHKLETYLAQTTDGAKILEGLEHRDLN